VDKRNWTVLATHKKPEPRTYRFDDAFADVIEEKFVATLRESRILPWPDILESYSTLLRERGVKIYYLPIANQY
jgi:hypothetical protein